MSVRPLPNVLISSPGAPVWGSRAWILGLQAAAGNRATGRWLARQTQQLEKHSDLVDIRRELSATDTKWDEEYGVYWWFNGMSEERMIAVYKQLTPAHRKKLEDNLDRTQLDRARMYQAIQQAKANVGAWWQEKAQAVHGAIRSGNFTGYPDGAYWIINPLNDKDRARIMTFLDAYHLDDLLAREAEAVDAGVPNAKSIAAEARKARATRSTPARAFNPGAMSDADLKAEAARITAALSALPRDKKDDRTKLLANLKQLEDTAELRGFDLPAVTAYTLREVIAPLQADVRQFKTTLKATADTQVGMNNRPFGDLMVTGEIPWGNGQLDWTLKALDDALGMIKSGENGGAQSDLLFRDAGTRYVAALFDAQSVGIWLAYLQTAAMAMKYAIPFPLEVMLMQIYGVRQKLQPTINDLRTLDPQKVEAAANRFSTEAKPFVADYKAFVDQFDKAAENYRQLMTFMAIYELVIGALAGIEMVPGGGPSASAPVIVRLAGFGGISGGAATGATIVISTEWIEMIRRLGMIGAVSVGMASSTIGLALPGHTIGPAGPTVLLRATPGGSVTPSSGPDAGRSVNYGDSRGKHTKVADHPLSEMKQAIANPSSAPADLKDMQSNIGNPGYGSQLSKEATDNYGALVKDALENGTRVSPSQIDHVASSEIGINIMNGNATARYRMFYSPGYGGWHLFPR